MKEQIGQQTPATPVDTGASRADQPPAGWRLWWTAIRPRTLSLSVAPVLAATALAWSDLGRLELLPFLASLIGALAIQSGTNLHNDVADALRGGDQPMRQGPPRLTALGWASPERVRRAALICYALAIVVGVYLIWYGGWPIAALGIASLIAGWAYSGGSRPVAYTPFGEVFVIAFFGLAPACGSYYLQTLTLTPMAVLLGVAFGAVAAAVLLANNYRDLEHDRLVGRRTLAIRVGTGPSKAFYALFVLGPIVVLASPAGPAGGWLTLGALPMAAMLVRRFATEARGPAFNGILAATGKLQVLMAALLIVGLAL